MTKKTHEHNLDAVNDSTISQAVYSRRDLLSRSSMGVAALALAGVPAGLAMMANTAQAQGTDATAAFTLMLRLSLLQQAFYAAGQEAAFTKLVGEPETAQPDPFTEAESQAVDQILANETDHVSTLSALATAPADTYDFTGGSGSEDGPFSLTSKEDFFAAAQLLADASVRAYKGQFENLLGNANLTTAFQIHSVEARHAAQIRNLRGQSLYPPNASSEGEFGGGFTEEQLPHAIAVYGPTVSAPDANGNPVESVGEDNKIQKSSYAPAGITAFDATAFDEPLSAANVATILDFFTA
jgi:hypothetical protein